MNYIGQMMEQKISDFISKIKSIQHLASYDESSTKQALILPVLNTLGWDIFNINIKIIMYFFPTPI